MANNTARAETQAQALSRKHIHEGRHWHPFTYSIMFSLLYLLMGFPVIIIEMILSSGSPTTDCDISI